MHSRIHYHARSFQFALEGIIHTWKNERNFTIHVILSVIAIILGFLFGLSKEEFLIILILITMGLAAELANTAIEAVTDLITKEHRIEAKIAKDAAAGMMLIVAVGSTIIALIIFVSRILLIIYY